MTPFPLTRRIAESRRIPGLMMAVLPLLMSPLLCGQQPGSPGHPATPGAVIPSPPRGDSPGLDSPVMYRSFFGYYHNLSNWIDSRTAANSAEGKQLISEAAKLHGIQESEYHGLHIPYPDSEFQTDRD